jgi:hypothetical protein
VARRGPGGSLRGAVRAGGAGHLGSAHAERVTGRHRVARDRARLLEPVRGLGRHHGRVREGARGAGRVGDGGCLPDDRCQAPHWGYLFSGKIVVYYKDRSETIEGGSAYYIEPGHAIEFLEASEALEFTPTAALERTFAAVRRNAGS